ncbi:MAG: DUF413 domain-containing protein [Aestuariibacter sp.]
MTKVTRDNLLTRRFHDPKNYPYGFSRSGDFSIAEANALQQYGNLISALVSGNISASNDEDKSLLAVANGEKAPDTLAERAWSKYLARINRTKTGSIYGCKGNNTDNDDTNDIDEEIDDDEPLDSELDIAKDED